jgi:hypothetical protein
MMGSPSDLFSLPSGPNASTTTLPQPAHPQQFSQGVRVSGVTELDPQEELEERLHKEREASEEDQKWLQQVRKQIRSLKLKVIDPTSSQ